MRHFVFLRQFHRNLSLDILQGNTTCIFGQVGQNIASSLRRYWLIYMHILIVFVQLSPTIGFQPPEVMLFKAYVT